MPFIEVDEENFDGVLAEELAKEHTVILKFSSTLCDSCEIMEYELSEVHERVPKVSILHIDAGVSEGLLYRFLIEQVPTTLILKDADTQLLYKTGIMLADDIVDVILKGR